MIDVQNPIIFENIGYISFPNFSRFGSDRSDPSMNRKTGLKKTILKIFCYIWNGNHTATLVPNANLH